MILPWAFMEFLAPPLATGLDRPLWLKRTTTLDMLLPSGLYTSLAQAGGAAARIFSSIWTLGFSTSPLLSLAPDKRCSELAP